MSKKGEAPAVVVCTSCKRVLTFANVIYFLPDVIVCRCPCRPESNLTCGEEHPRFAAVRKALLGAAFANILIPYTASEYPAFSLPGTAQHEQNLMHLAMMHVGTAAAFERECKEERRVPDSDEGETRG